MRVSFPEVFLNVSFGSDLAGRFVSPDVSPEVYLNVLFGSMLAVSPDVLPEVFLGASFRFDVS